MTRNIVFAALAAAIVAILLYLPALSNQFVFWDDDIYIINNPHIRSLSAQTLKWAFFDYYYFYWIPLTWISLAVDYAVWGVNPFGYHLTNIMLHALNAFLATVLAVRLLQSHDERTAEGGVTGENAGVSPVLFALVFGLLFAVHPLQVETVAWATERKGLLSGLFALAALLSYLRYAQDRPAVHVPLMKQFHERWYLFTCIFVLLSLLSKPTTVTLPLLFLLLDWFPLARMGGGRWQALVVEKIPLLLGCLIVTLITLVTKAPTKVTLADVSLGSRVYVASRGFVEYLRLIIWPSDLAALYDHPGNSVAVLSVRFAVPIIAITLISIACIYLFLKGRKVYLAVIASMMILLLPVLGFTQSGGQALADRFMYIPIIGPLLLMALAAGQLYRKLSHGMMRLGVLACILAAVSCYAAVTHGQIQTWRTTESLWNNAIAMRPSQAGRAFVERARYYANRGDYVNALRDADQALEILGGIGYSRIAKVFSLRADIYQGMGRFAEAESDRLKAQGLPSAWESK